MADLKAYLAEKYMSGPKADAILSRVAQKKKKKKKAGAATAPTASSSFIRDDDGGWGWNQNDNEEEDVLVDATVAADRTFKKRKVAPSESSNWITVQEGEKKDDDEIPPDEQPMLVEPEADSLKGGLMVASKLRKMNPTGRAQEKETISAEMAAQAQETVYRDSSGRRIDTKVERAAAARAKREREEKEAEKMEWGKGLVQKEEQERRKQELEKERGKAFARHVDDKDLNEELKSKELWNDPAAAFLTKKSRGPRRPEYNGPPPPPNRFGIKPGYRWDGVDRSNGFEKKFFQSLNSKKRRGQESYQWSVDDM